MPARAFRDKVALKAFREAVAEDLSLLTRLHLRELDAGTLAGLGASGFPNRLGFRLRSEAGRVALALMEGAVRGLPGGRDGIPLLAKDFHAVYLSPGIIDPRRQNARSGDDIGGSLTVVGQLIGGGGGFASLHEAAIHLDGGVLDAIEPFCQWVSRQSLGPFYPGLALLTAAYGRELRELLRQLLEDPCRAGPVHSSVQAAFP